MFPSWYQRYEHYLPTSTFSLLFPFLKRVNCTSKNNWNKIQWIVNNNKHHDRCHNDHINLPKKWTNRFNPYKECFLNPLLITFLSDMISCLYWHIINIILSLLYSMAYSSDVANQWAKLYVLIKLMNQINYRFSVP